MSSEYFYCPPGSVAGETLEIGGEEFAHLVHVMRRKPGDAIVAVDGRGNAYDAVIASIDRRTAVCSIAGRRASNGEPALRLTLAAAVLKNPSRYDFLVEKATELGVSEFAPMRTERSISERARIGRWRKLALAAMKQSGRSWLPPVREPAALSEVLAEHRSVPVKLVAHEKGPGDGPALPSGGAALLLVGPEGGFTDGEISLCLEAGCRLLFLGERRLRAETAAVAAAALLIR